MGWPPLRAELRQLSYFRSFGAIIPIEFLGTAL
jgi:hypothetical protein